MTFLDQFKEAMSHKAVKVVSKTDLAKGAYVPDEAQKNVLAIAGFKPVGQEVGRLIPIRRADTLEVLETTYYNSKRKEPGRKPEPRMGRGIVSLLQVGKPLWIGTDGKTVFVLTSNDAKSVVSEVEIDVAVERIATELSAKRLLEMANKATGIPERRETRSVVFERNQWVRQYARKRSGGKCEMPGCKYVGFKKDDGTPYIEVHHIQSLAKEGGDVIENVAAVCPECHAKAHYANNRNEIEAAMRNAVSTANARYREQIAKS